MPLAVTVRATVRVYLVCATAVSVPAFQVTVRLFFSQLCVRLCWFECECARVSLSFTLDCVQVPPPHARRCCASDWWWNGGYANC